MTHAGQNIVDAFQGLSCVYGVGIDYARLRRRQFPPVEPLFIREQTRDMTGIQVSVCVDSDSALCYNSVPFKKLRFIAEMAALCRVLGVCIDYARVSTLERTDYGYLLSGSGEDMNLGLSDPDIEPQDKMLAHSPPCQPKALTAHREMEMRALLNEARRTATNRELDVFLGRQEILNQESLKTLLADRAAGSFVSIEDGRHSTEAMLDRKWRGLGTDEV